MRIETFKGADGWRWRMRADNGEILSTSEAYTRKADAMRTAKLVRDSPIEFDILPAKEAMEETPEEAL